MIRAFAAVLCLFFGGLAAPVSAAVVSFTFDAGPVIFRAANNLRPNMSFFSNFIIGESILVTITIDDQSPDLRPINPFAGRYVDRLTGGATITGKTSGTTFDITNGIEIELDRPREIDFTSPPINPANIDNTTILFDEPNGGDIDILARFFNPITFQPNVLTNVIAGFERKLTGAPDFLFDRVQLAQDSTASIVFFNQNGPRTALEFGPVPGRNTPAPVPVPTSVAMMGSAVAALAGLGAWRRRKTT